MLIIDRMNNIQPISCGQSITGHFVQKACGSLLVESTDSSTKKFTKLTLSTLTFAGLCIIGIIESLVRGAFFLLILLGKQIIPSSDYETKIFIPVKESTTLSMQATANAFKSLFQNYCRN